MCTLHTEKPCLNSRITAPWITSFDFPAPETGGLFSLMWSGILRAAPPLPLPFVLCNLNKSNRENPPVSWGTTTPQEGPLPIAQNFRSREPPWGRIGTGGPALSSLCWLTGNLAVWRGLGACPQNSRECDKNSLAPLVSLSAPLCGPLNGPGGLSLVGTLPYPAGPCSASLASSRALPRPPAAFPT